MNVVDVDSSSIVLSHRLTPLNTPPLEKGCSVYLTLQEILIIGNNNDQVSVQYQSSCDVTASTLDAADNIS